MIINALKSSSSADLRNKSLLHQTQRFVYDSGVGFQKNKTQNQRRFHGFRKNSLHEVHGH